VTQNLKKTDSKQEWLNALQLMRIPFSFFLMPVYWFALLNTEVNISDAIAVFVILHFFVYPASNGYNSYYDRDEQSIGGLKSPPKVTRQLWYLVVLFDILGILLSLLVNLPFATMIIMYLLVSKAYSFDKIRLKKYPLIGALTVIFFQGWFTYTAVQVGVTTDYKFTMSNLLFGFVSSLFLLGSYPMTQIYQHQEDTRRGDVTLSRMLGIHGTFVFTAVIFLIASAGTIILFYWERNILNIFIYFVALVPVNIYFIKWYIDYRKGKLVITYERTMMLNAMSSMLLSGAFIIMKMVNCRWN
jgi:1,4-dihydroxy-2-naphthoate octaprenyltransferase